MDIVVQILVWLRGLDSWLLVSSISGALFFLFLFSKRGARFISFVGNLKRKLFSKQPQPKALVDEGMEFIPSIGEAEESEDEVEEELEIESDERMESPVARLDLLDRPPVETESKTRPKSMSRIMEQLAIVKDELAFGSRQVLEDFDSITDPNAIEEAEARLVNEPDNVGLIDWLLHVLHE